MTLPSSGALSASAINTELNKTATSTISLNDTDARTLAQLYTTNTAISYKDFRNRSYFKETISWSTPLGVPTRDSVVTLTITGKPNSSFGYYMTPPSGPLNRTQTFTGTFDASGNYSLTGLLFEIGQPFSSWTPGIHTLTVIFTGGTGTNKTSTIDLMTAGFVIRTNTRELDVRTWMVNSGWDGSSATTVYVNSGVYVWSDYVSVPAMWVIGSFPYGLAITINGYVMGKGGLGGHGAEPSGPGLTAGERGGVAIMVGVGSYLGYSGGTVNITVNSSGILAGGGGGGGGGAGFRFSYGYGGGGGGGGAGGGNGGISGSGDGGGLGAGGLGGAVGMMGGSGMYGGGGRGLSGQGGGGGGRILTGLNSAGGNANGGGGGSGGGGGYAGGGIYNGAAGGGPGVAGSNASLGGGGGGGWGAAGGSSQAAGGAAGPAVVKNNFTVNVTTYGLKYGTNVTGAW